MRIIQKANSEIMKMKHIAILTFCLIFLSSCDNSRCRIFERNFFQKIDDGQVNAIKNGFDIFDLSSITDFEWDSVFLIRGNESVSVFKEHIDEMLNGRKSHIHWEKRRYMGYIDTTFRWRTEDLRVDRDRFYFLTPNKELVVREIERRRLEHKPAFGIQCSCCEVNILNFPILRWFSRQEAKFKLTSNTQEIGQGTVLLHVNCAKDYKE